ncbi:MAG: hypothetical protein JXA42_26135 [Anaerolineales bacterium]|nr:hypothetical protein [Anaerolineales bacterium]
MQDTSFDRVLEAADNLPPDEQESLIEILRKRVYEKRCAESKKARMQYEEEYLRTCCPGITQDEIEKIIGSKNKEDIT